MATLMITLVSLLALTRLILGVNWAATAQASRDAFGAVRQAMPTGEFLHRNSAENRQVNNYVMVHCESEYGLKGQIQRIQRAV
jgi:hypothetical protein